MSGYMPPSQSDEWETPPWLFRKLNEEFHFDLDAAASESNRKCEKFLSIDRDGLIRTWTVGGTIGHTHVFLNPPHSLLDEFMRKAFHESKVTMSHPRSLVVCLIPVKADTRWWHEVVQFADEVRFIRGRIKFLKEGKPVQSSTFASCIVIFRPNHGPAEPTQWKFVDFPERLS